MQTSYSLSMNEGTPGLIASAGGSPRTVLTYNNPVDAIEFGRAVAKVSGTDGACQLPSGGSAVIVGVAVRDTSVEGISYVAKSNVGALRRGQIYVEVENTVTEDSDVYVRHSGRAQVQTFVLSGDAITGDAITGNTIAATFNGTAITQAFDTDHLTTMNALAAQIQALADVATATVGGSGNRTITITAAVNGVDVAITSAAITGGVSQATITVTTTVTGVLNSKKGLFRSNSDTSTALQLTNARFVKGATAGNCAIVDLNIP